MIREVKKIMNNKSKKTDNSKRMLLSSKLLWVFSMLVGLSSFAIYPFLPDLIPTHWGVSGNIDAYSNKAMVFLFAFLPLIFMGLFYIIPKIDPKRKSYQLHGRAYELVVFSLVIFISAVYFITTAVAMGYNMPVDTLMKLGMGILFIIMGNVLSQVRHNYFFGIRTPWTLASEAVWRRTHRVGSYGFVIAGIFAFISALFKGTLSFAIMFIPLMILIVFLFVYSYLIFKKLEWEDKNA